MKYYIKNYNEIKPKDIFSNYVLGIDVGGTNTNLGIAGIKKNKLKMLFSLNFKSQELSSILPAIEKTIKYAKEKYNIEIASTCIGAAGIISESNDKAELTNVKRNIELKEITKKTPLKLIKIINDFQTIGFGLNLIDKNNKKEVFKITNCDNKIKNSKATKAIIGAGTGLGKSILIYNNTLETYIPIKSEGGHGDLPVYNQNELDLVEYIKKNKKISQPINYEEILSGRGIENIYSYLINKKEKTETKYSREIEKSKEKASLISKYKETDETCKKTFNIYTKFYARCAKNFVLDTLAEGGLYIYGGIAAKNKEIFTKKDFIDEFEKSNKRSKILKKIPIKIILNYDLSIYGACYAAMLELIKKENKIN